MADPRVEKFARILVDYSTRVKPGDRVAIYTSTAAEELVQVLCGLILDRGGHPNVLLEVADYEEIVFTHASDEQLEYVPSMYKVAFEECDVLMKVRAETNTRALTNTDPARQSHRQKNISTLLGAQMRRSAQGSLRWVTTLFPTRAYAMEADMGFEEFKTFAFRACAADADTPDPVAFWQTVQQRQQQYIKRIEGHDRIVLRGPNVDLKLSIKGRKFVNACGHINMPDGEIYTGPVENSLNGWVRYSYPAVYMGRVVEGIELTFKEGKVVKATADKNQDFLLKMLDSDAGSHYVGEFAIGTNYQINRATKSILFDEKIGGSFHMALGSGYVETGSQNRSSIHWDMICSLQQDSEILADDEPIYRNGQFLLK